MQLRIMFIFVLSSFAILNIIGSEQNVAKKCESEVGFKLTGAQIMPVLYNQLENFPNELKKLVFDYVNPDFENEYIRLKNEFENFKKLTEQNDITQGQIQIIVESLKNTYKAIKALRVSIQKLYSPALLQSIINLEREIQFYSLDAFYTFGFEDFNEINKFINDMNNYFSDTNEKILNRLKEEIDKPTLSGLNIKNRFFIWEFACRLILNGNIDILDVVLNLIIKNEIMIYFDQQRINKLLKLKAKKIMKQINEDELNQLNNLENNCITVNCLKGIIEQAFENGKEYRKILYDHFLNLNLGETLIIKAFYEKYISKKLNE